MPEGNTDSNPRDFDRNESANADDGLDAEAFLRDYEQKLRKRPYRAPEKKSESDSSQVTPDASQFDKPKMALRNIRNSNPEKRRSPQQDEATHRSFKGTPAGDELPPEGSILWLDSGDIALLDRCSPKLDQQLLLLLNDDGTLNSVRLNLRQTPYEKIGQVPVDDMVSINIAEVWHRAHILFHLDNFKDSVLIPAGANGQAPASSRTPTRSADWPAHAEDFNKEKELPEKDDPTNVEQGKTPYKLKRGQEFTIDFGAGRSWTAIYWGGDGTGSLVVHNTHDEYALTRLDFKRFPPESVKVGEMLDERKLWEIQEYLKRMYT